MKIRLDTLEVDLMIKGRGTSSVGQSLLRPCQEVLRWKDGTCTASILSYLS